MNIAYQGSKGAYSEQAALQLYPKAATKGFETLKQVFTAVKKGKVQLGIIPIENSTAGSINQTYDLLLKNKLPIVGENYLRIQHCLLANKHASLKTVRKVFSHPQALAQCDNFLHKARLEQFATFDTAGSIKYLEGHNDAAIVASAYAAKVYNLKILKKNIENSRLNTTRFVVIAKNQAKKQNNAKTSLVLEAAHIHGALYKCLGCFAINKINLTKLESRPHPTKPFSYVFYLDFEGSPEQQQVKIALKELKHFTTFIKILGSYGKDKK